MNTTFNTNVHNPLDVWQETQKQLEDLKNDSERIASVALWLNTS